MKEQAIKKKMFEDRLPLGIAINICQVGVLKRQSLNYYGVVCMYNQETAV